MSDVVVIQTGTANTASVAAAIRRAGCEVRLSQDPGDAAGAARLVLPGVGAFGSVVSRIDELKLRDTLTGRIMERRPTLAICLGLQLLAQGSDETPGIEGLGVLPTRVTGFGEGLRVPHLGWNRVSADESCALLEDGEAYFANSYKLDRTPDGWAGATAEHGAPFVAAVESGPVLACQFHPELSGPWGQRLIERWLAAGEVA